MIAEPFWLPSTIMQTAGALIGIFLVVYVYTSEHAWQILAELFERGETAEVKRELILNRRTLVKMERASLLSALIMGCFTIGINLIWLERLTENPDTIFPTLKVLSLFSFFSMLLLLLIYSLLTVVWIHKLKEGSIGLDRKTLLYEEISDVIKKSDETIEESERRKGKTF